MRDLIEHPPSCMCSACHPEFTDDERKFAIEHERLHRIFTSMRRLEKYKEETK